MSEQSPQSRQIPQILRHGNAIAETAPGSRTTQETRPGTHAKSRPICTDWCIYCESSRDCAAESRPSTPPEEQP